MPATVKMIGFEKMKADVAHFKREVAEKGLNAAQNAAARVIKAATQAAAPVGETGRLRGSFTTTRTRNKDLSVGMNDYDIPAVKVGPSRKGFYGYFLEHGWKATGPKRRKRTATKTTHSQSGTSNYRNIPGRQWFERAVQRVENTARQAAERALMQTIRKLAG